MIKTLTPIIAIITIGLLEALALSKGIDGVLLAGSVAVIAGLGGFSATRIIRKKPPDKTPPA